jgi:hypothetical protein
MEKIKRDFFQAWEDEITAYQEVALVLTNQKIALMKWDIKKFQGESQEAAMLISSAHKATDVRHSTMESMLFLLDQQVEKNSLKTISNVFEDDEEKERARVFFKVFTNTIRNIDKLSAENKELIRTGLELVGENLEMIADIIDRDRVYSRVGMINQKRSALLLNKRV